MRITLLSATLLATGIASAATPVDGWYTSVFGGYTFVPVNVSTIYFGNFIDNASFNGGYNVGGRVGYKSNPLRYEAEYTFLQANAKSFKINHIEQTGITGYSSANLIMANIYYDTPEMLPSISPYLGMGIGYAYIQDALTSTGPLGVTYFNMTNSSFAYQGTVGLTYNFAENYAISLAYRYVATSTTGNFGSIFQAHNASAGAIYRFDYGNYK
jgi:opacity protein-like surface antigen